MCPEADLLKEVPLFQLLDDSERTELAAQLDVVHFPGGQTIFNISSGEVEVFFKNDTGDILVRPDRPHRLLPNNTDLDIATVKVRTTRSPS